MLKSIICLGFAVLTTAQWAFTVPDGDLGEVAPGNNVRQGAIHNFKWQVGLGNEPVKVLDDEGHASLWITSGLDHSFNKLLASECVSQTALLTLLTLYSKCRLVLGWKLGMGHWYPLRR